MEIMNALTFLWMWWILGWIITIWLAHFLEKSKIDSQRKYDLKKEEFFYYKKISEEIIKKLLILENQSELFKIYLQLSYSSSLEENSKFIDANKTLDKDVFENNLEDITTKIFIYFSNLWQEWNNCMDIMSKLYSVIFNLNLEIENWVKINWKEKIDSFNEAYINLWNKPHELSKSILEICKQREDDLK